MASAMRPKKSPGKCRGSETKKARRSEPFEWGVSASGHHDHSASREADGAGLHLAAGRGPALPGHRGTQLQIGQAAAARAAPAARRLPALAQTRMHLLRRVIGSGRAGDDGEGMGGLFSHAANYTPALRKASGDFCRICSSVSIRPLSLLKASISSPPSRNSFPRVGPST